MEKKSLSKDTYDFDQLKKYAKDIAVVYKSEKQKKEALEAGNQQIVKYAIDLNKAVSELKAVNQELQEAYIDTIHRLVLVAEYKDEDTGNHIKRISLYSALIAEKIGLPADGVQDILYASPMHDVGKVGVPDNMLLKPGRLTEQEFECIKAHTLIGADILANSRGKILRIAEQIAISHHEKWNGKGYPYGLYKKKIPIVGRIVGLVDVFDALTSKRPYKDPYPVDVACDMIKKERGQHFDPDLVDVFMKNIDEILSIKAEVDLKEGISTDDFTWSERDLVLNIS
ncbi:MAG: HD domain-containing protein [Thermodesulfobacteriota bacterium]|nr:HD domain-containing protein [Thermodesulfobacteriota bacterium]